MIVLRWMAYAGGVIAILITAALLWPSRDTNDYL
jgi:hypothetical protein